MAAMESTEEPNSAPQEDKKKEKYTYSASSFKIKTSEEELFELVQLSEVPIDKELFKVILEMLKLNIAPVAILQVLKSLKSPQAIPAQSTESVKSKDPSKPHSSKTHTTKSTKKTSIAKEASSSSQEAKRPSSKHSSRSFQKRTGTSSTGSVRKERTSSKT